MTTAVRTEEQVDAPVRSGVVLAIILVAYFMILMDNSVIFTGLPSIERSLRMSDTGLSWVQDAYALVFGGLLLLGARAGDIVGRRRLFVVGLAIFTLASFLIGVSATGGQLIAARVLQGVGAAIVAPTSLSLITTYFQGEARGRAVAWFGVTSGIGASVGLVAGGALADWISWRAGFFVNVPIGIAMMVAAVLVLPPTPRRGGRFDLGGAVLATVGMFALVFGIIGSAEHGWADPRTIGGIVVGLVVLALLVGVESRAQEPIMPLRLFADRRRSGAYAARVLYMGAMIGFFYFTTQLMQGVLGWSPLQAGLGFLPMTIVNFVVALAVPGMVQRFGEGRLVAGGTLLTFLGMAWLSTAGIGDTYLAAIALPMAVIGVGQGLVFAPLTSLGLWNVDAQDAGAASGLVNTAHQLGMALGLSVLVTLVSHLVDGDSVAALSERVSTALAGSAGLLALALVLSAIVLAPAHHRATVDAEVAA